MAASTSGGLGRQTPSRSDGRRHSFSDAEAVPPPIVAEFHERRQAPRTATTATERIARLRPAPRSSASMSTCAVTLRRAIGQKVAISPVPRTTLIAAGYRPAMNSATRPAASRI